MGTSSAMASLTPNQYDIIYNSLSLRLPSFSERYRAALCFTGLVTFIAMYHYFRIFDSFNAAFTPCKNTNGTIDYNTCDPETYGYTATGIPFNDAYRYVDWFLTVPLLLIEIVLVMRLSEEETFQRCTTLGVSSGLMESQDSQPEACREQVKWACWATVFSWCTYPVVYTFPMLAGSSSGKSGLSAQAMVAIQIGYTFSDVISKCGVGYLVYRIGLAKSMMEKGEYEEA